jgi:hypothetical protein
MSVTVETGSTIAFDAFWKWLKHHPNCILRAGTVECYLYDQDAFHWHLEEDADRNPVVQLVQGKEMVAEMIVEARDVLFVQAVPDPESGEGHYLFELVGGSKDETYAVYHFLVAHGFEEEGRHKPALKH